MQINDTDDFVSFITGQTSNTQINGDIDLKSQYNVINAPFQDVSTDQSTLISRQFGDDNYTATGTIPTQIQSADLTTTFIANSGILTANQNIDLTSHKIINSTLPTANGDLASKLYVDTVNAGSLPITATLSAISNLNPNDGDVLFNNWKITQLADGTLTTDAVNLGQLTASANLKRDYSDGNDIISITAPNTLSVDMNNQLLINLSDPASNQDATTKNYTDTQDNLRYLNTTTLNNITLPDGNVNMFGYQIKNLANPTLVQDAANKQYVDNNFMPITSTLQTIQTANPIVADISLGAFVPTTSKSTGFTNTQLPPKIYNDAQYMPIASSLSTISNTNLALSAINANTQNIENVKNAVLSGDAVNFGQITTSLALKRNQVDTLADINISSPNDGDLDLGGFQLYGLTNSILDDGAATIIQLKEKEYIAHVNTGVQLSSVVCNIDDVTIFPELTSVNPNYLLIKQSPTFPGGIVLDANTNSIELNGNLIMNNHFVGDLPLPVNIADAATKGYVDSAISGASSTFIESIDTTSRVDCVGTNSVQLTGILSLLTNSLDFGGLGGNNALDPVLAQDIATKNYTDTAIATAISGGLATNFIKNIGNTASVTCVNPATAEVDVVGLLSTESINMNNNLLTFMQNAQGLTGFDDQGVNVGFMKTYFPAKIQDDLVTPGTDLVVSVKDYLFTSPNATLDIALDSTCVVTASGLLYLQNGNASVQMDGSFNAGAGQCTLGIQGKTLRFNNSGIYYNIASASPISINGDSNSNIFLLNGSLVLQNLDTNTCTLSLIGSLAEFASQGSALRAYGFRNQATPVSSELVTYGLLGTSSKSIQDDITTPTTIVSAATPGIFVYTLPTGITTTQQISGGQWLEVSSVGRKLSGPVANTLLLDNTLANGSTLASGSSNIKLNGSANTLVTTFPSTALTQKLQAGNYQMSSTTGMQLISNVTNQLLLNSSLASGSVLSSGSVGIFAIGSPETVVKIFTGGQLNTHIVSSNLQLDSDIPLKIKSQVDNSVVLSGTLSGGVVLASDTSSMTLNGNGSTLTTAFPLGTKIEGIVSSAYKETSTIPLVFESNSINNLTIGSTQSTGVTLNSDTSSINLQGNTDTITYNLGVSKVDSISGGFYKQTSTGGLLLDGNSANNVNIGVNTTNGIQLNSSGSFLNIQGNTNTLTTNLATATLTQAVVSSAYKLSSANAIVIDSNTATNVIKLNTATTAGNGIVMTSGSAVLSLEGGVSVNSLPLLTSSSGLTTRNVFKEHFLLSGQTITASSATTITHNLGVPINKLDIKMFLTLTANVSGFVIGDILNTTYCDQGSATGSSNGGVFRHSSNNAVIFSSSNSGNCSIPAAGGNIAVIPWTSVTAEFYISRLY